MKRNLFHSALVIMTILFIGSCKKEETTTPPSPESAPISTALLINSATTVIATGAGTYEYGCKFKVTKNGKITKLASKMPEAGSYRVTLWEIADSVTHTVVGQATLTQAAGTLTFGAITPVVVTTGKTYQITIWSDVAWYDIRPTAGGNFSYPITQGSISITGYTWTGAPQVPITYPTNVSLNYVAGLADFEFQAD